MTREEFEYAIKSYGCYIYRGQTYYEESELIKAFEDMGLIEQEPCEKVAQERYADLCEYFGGAKDILKNRKDFKAWLKRVKWHIHKAEELYEKYEYKKEPCEDAISRQTVLNTEYQIKEINGIEYVMLSEVQMKMRKLPPVKPQEKTGHWIAQDIYNCHTDFKCSECGYIHSFMHLYGKPTADYTYCPNCGAKMVEEQERKKE